MEASFKCPKCQNSENEIGEIRAAGGIWSKIFDIQNKKFHTVSCKNCGYTEMYKKGTKTAENVIDFLTR
jgi:predicted nucleic-acid-binding Zn-ribbon protein